MTTQPNPPALPRISSSYQLPADTKRKRIAILKIVIKGGQIIDYLIKEGDDLPLLLMPTLQ